MTDEEIRERESQILSILSGLANKPVTGAMIVYRISCPMSDAEDDIREMSVGKISGLTVMAGYLRPAAKIVEESFERREE